MNENRLEELKKSIEADISDSQQERAILELFKISRHNGSTIRFSHFSEMCDISRETLHRYLSGSISMPSKYNTAKILRATQQIKEIRAGWAMFILFWDMWPKAIHLDLWGRDIHKIIESDQPIEDKVEQLTGIAIKLIALNKRSK